jgi:DNA-binding LytR/AlgR family response regulator
MAIKTVIIDDETPSREEIKVLLDKYKEFKIVGEFSNAYDGLSGVIKEKPELIFIDVNMPGISGIKLIESIKDIDEKPMVVFVTAYSEYAVKAFELEALDYIVKPIEEKRFSKTISKILSQNKRQTSFDAIVGYHENEILVRKSEDAILFESNKGKIMAEFEDMILRLKFRNLQEVLDAYGEKNFFKANKSIIINLNKISRIIPWFKNRYLIEMKNKKRVKLSPHHQKEFKDRIKF